MSVGPSSQTAARTNKSFNGGVGAGLLGQSPKRGSCSKRPDARGSQLAPFDTSIYAFPVATQTDTEHFFRDDAPLEDELSLQDYDSIFHTSRRLFKILNMYEWNPQTTSYLLRGHEEEDVDVEERAALPPAKDEKSRPAWKNLQALHTLKVKVERAHNKATVCALEEEMARWQACAQDSFEPWISKTCKELGSTRRGGRDEAGGAGGSLGGH